MFNRDERLLRTIRLDGPSDATPSTGTFYSGQTELTVCDLEPNTSVTFAVVSHNGSGVAQATVTGRTQPLTVTQAPSLEVQLSSDSSAQLSWNDVANETAYQVLYGPTGQAEQNQLFDANSTSGIIDGLAPNTTYEFTVVAANRIGGVSSDTMTLVTPDGDPTSNDGVSGFVNSDGFIVVEGSGQAVVGLNFLSDGGLLSTVGNASPFGFFLSETPNQVTLGVLGQANAVTLDGTLVTPVQYSGGNPSQDVTAIWGDTSSVLTEFDVTTPANPGVADGLVGFIDSDGFVTLRGSGEKVVKSL